MSARSPLSSLFKRWRHLNFANKIGERAGRADFSAIIVYQSVTAFLLDKLKATPIVQQSVEPNRLWFPIHSSPPAPDMVGRQRTPHAVYLCGFCFIEAGHNGK